jgi:thymidylate kinase
MVVPAETHPTPGPPVILQADTRSLTRVVLNTLDEAHVKWSLIRGTAGSGDIDVLVAAADLARAATAIREHGLVRLGGYGRGTHVFFLGLDEATGTYVKFDLVTELAFGPYFEVRTGAAEACLARRQRGDGTWVLAPEDEFWVLLLHCILDKGAFAEKHIRRLGQLAESASLDSPLVRAMPRHVPWAALLENLRASEWQLLTATRRRILRSWWRAAPASVSAARARTIALRLAERPVLAWTWRGLSVALLGPDGSGKSTLAAAMESSSYFPVRRVYMGVWPASDTPQWFGRTALHIASRPFVAWWRYLGALRHQAMGQLVVFDRYVYDALLPPRGSLAWLMRPYLRILSRSCPPPSLVVLLDAPGDVMHARSGEYDPAHLEAERDHYRRHARRIPNAVRVDSDRPREAVLADVMTLIWRHYKGRIGR